METKEIRLENPDEVGYKARKEAEDFLNRWLDDNTKGWAVRSGLVSSYDGQFSAPLDIIFN